LQPNHKLIADFLHSMMARDRAALSRLIAEEAIWHVPPSCIPAYRGPHLGLQAILKLIAGAGGDLFVTGSQRAEIQHLIAEGEIVAAQFRQIGRLNNGRHYDNLYSFFFRCKNGQISEVWENLDTGYFYGLLEMDPAWVRETQ
jgi:ketosteroid isomerase-like protein